MNVGGSERVNERATYDIFFRPGLYREGQMKLVGGKVTLEELKQGKFQYTFPDTGWYTIIVRTQEREREYAMFFIAGKE